MQTCILKAWGIDLEKLINDVIIAGLSILSLSDQILLSRHVTESRTVVDIKSLPVGVYVVTIVGEEGVQVGKFVKKH